MTSEDRIVDELKGSVESQHSIIQMSIICARVGFTYIIMPLL